MKETEIVLRRDIHPDTRFYYRQQFKVYVEPYLLWNWNTWETILSSCTVYRIEVGGKYAGDVILEQKGRGTRYIVDFSLLPEFQGRGLGRSVMRQLKNSAKRLTAFTRKETLGFFLESGFVLKRKVKDFYDPGIEGYYLTLASQVRSSADREEVK